MPPFIFTSTGVISSLHDQACELFYQLKGGCLHYGKTHSAANKHKNVTRFYGTKAAYNALTPDRASEQCRTCEVCKAGAGAHCQDFILYAGDARYPEWSAAYPLDFVAHSMGAPVVRMLQYLLAEGFFSTECGFEMETSEHWIRSLTAFAGAFNGSPLTWILGADEEDGIVRNKTSLISFAAFFIKHLASAQRRSKPEKRFFDLHLDQWDFFDSLLKPKEMSDRFFSACMGDRDWAVYDLTPNAMEKHNDYLRDYDCTWYFSNTVRTTVPCKLVKKQVPSIFTHLYLRGFSREIANYTMSGLWRDKLAGWDINDGMCSTSSQDYPKLGKASEFKSLENEKNDDCVYQKGVWNIVSTLKNTDHAEVAMNPHFLRWRSGEALYRKAIDRIMKLRLQCCSTET